MNPTSEDQSGGVATASPPPENASIQPASGAPVPLDKGGLWPAPGAAKSTGEATSWDAAKQARANQMEEAKNNKSGGFLSKIFGGARKASPVSVETVTQPDPWAHTPDAGAEAAAASLTLTSAQMDEAMKAGNALVEPAPGPAKEFKRTSAQPPTSEIQAPAAASSVPEQTTPPVTEASAGETPVAEIPAAEPAAVADAVAETATPQPTAAVTEQTASVSEPASAAAMEQPVAASTAPDAPAAGLGMDITGNQVTNADLAAASTGPGMPNPLDVPKPPEATAPSGSPSLPPIPGLASPDIASPSVVNDGQTSQTTWNNEGVNPPVEAVATGNSEPAGVATAAPLEASTAALEEAKREEVQATAAPEVASEMNDPDKVAVDPMAPLAIEKLPGQPLDMSVTSDATTEPASASSVTLNSAQIDEAMKAGNALVEPAPGPAKEFEGTSAQPTTSASPVTTADAFGIPQEQPAAAPITQAAAPEQALSQTVMNDINQAAAGVDTLPASGATAPVAENPTVDAANQVVEASVASNPLPSVSIEAPSVASSSPEPVLAGVTATSPAGDSSNNQ